MLSPPPPRDRALRFWGESPGLTDTLTKAPLLLPPFREGNLFMGLIGVCKPS